MVNTVHGNGQLHYVQTARQEPSLADYPRRVSTKPLNLRDSLLSRLSVLLGNFAVVEILLKRVARLGTLGGSSGPSGNQRKMQVASAECLQRSHVTDDGLVWV
jgi:hypothetical protein